MTTEQPHDENETGYDKSLLSMAQILPISETFPGEDISEGMNRGEQGDDMFADMAENRKQETRDDNNDKKMTHSEDLSSIEKLLNTLSSKKGLYLQFR